MRVWLVLCYVVLIWGCSRPSAELKVQWDPAWREAVSSANSWMHPVPGVQELHGDTACADCGFSVSALAMEHDGAVDSLLYPWFEGKERCDSVCLEERGLRADFQKQLWGELAGASWQRKWLASFDESPKEGAVQAIAWTEPLSPAQKAALASVRVQGQSDLLVLSLVDRLDVIKRSGGGGVQVGAGGVVQKAAKGSVRGEVELVWWWTLWDLRTEKLLVSAHFRGRHTEGQTGDLDREFHLPARKMLRPWLEKAWENPQQEPR